MRIKIQNNLISTGVPEKYWGHFWLVFLLLCFGANTLFSQVILSSTRHVYLQLALLGVLLIRYRLAYTRSQLGLAVYLVLAVLTTLLVNGDGRNMNGYFVIVIRIVFAVVLLAVVQPRLFARAFADWMFLIAAASLVMTYFFDLLPFRNFVPLITNSMGVRFHYALLAVKIDAYGHFAARNYGIFSEPAVFCFYLLMACLFEMTVERAFFKKAIRIVTLTTALCSTLSPIGIVLGILVWGLFVIRYHRTHRQVFRYTIVLIGLAVLVLFWVPEAREELLRAWEKMDISGGNGLGRIGSIAENIEAWFRNPLLGGGLPAITGVTQTWGFNTSTTGALLSGFGAVFALIVTMLSLRTVRKLSAPAGGCCAAVWMLMFLAVWNNHGFIQSDWYWIFVMLGLFWSAYDRENTSDSAGQCGYPG